jgi:hypothetical protein
MSTPLNPNHADAVARFWTKVGGVPRATQAIP